MKKTLLMALPAAVLLLSFGPHAWAADYWTGLAGEICAEIDHAQQLAKAGDQAGAKDVVTTSYFALFEDRKMETAERSALGVKRAAEVEEMFSDLRKAIGKGAGSDVAAAADALRKALRNDGKSLDAAGIAADGIAVAK